MSLHTYNLLLACYLGELDVFLLMQQGPEVLFLHLSYTLVTLLWLHN